MLKKDLGLGVVIGAAVGLLMQPILTNVGQLVAFIGAEPSFAVRAGIFLVFFVLGPLGVATGYILGKVHEVIYQFVKFAAVGTLNSFINLGVLNFLIAASGISAGYWYSLFVLIGFLLATTNSFAWNKLWTFGDKSGVRAGQTFSFYAIAAVGALLNVGAASLVVNGIPHPGISGPVWANVGGLIGIAASFAWNFLGYKFFVFKKIVGGQEPLAETATDREAGESR